MAQVKRYKSTHNRDASNSNATAAAATTTVGRPQSKVSTKLSTAKSGGGGSAAPNISQSHNNNNNSGGGGSNNNNNNKTLSSPFKQMLNMKKSHIYNLEHRKKPDELRRKDLISAMKLPDHEILNRKDYFRILDQWKQDWERGVQVPVDIATLPKTNLKPFNQDSPSNKRTVSCDVSIRPTKCKEPFEQPDARIDYETSSDVFIGKYELDLQDISWLSAIRDSQLSLNISDAFMEDVINELEQECARNMKEKQIGIEFVEDTVCDVCQSGEVEDGNEIVFCELCNIGVHQACYGIETIPDDDWLCNVCRTIDTETKKKPCCVLCSKSGGALKPTTRKSNQWAHVSCAYWIPEVKFVNPTLLEPIDIKGINTWRFNLTCSLCNIKKGAPILCDEKNCRVAYHVTCAFKHRLKMKLVTQEDSNVRFKSYCLKHSEENGENTMDIFHPNNVQGTSKSEGRNMMQNSPNHEFWKHVDLKKLNDTITKQYSNTPDLLQPNGSEFDKINYEDGHLKQIIEMIYQYWKLKRICNNGNSLIKLTLAQKFEEHMNSTYHRMKSFRFHMERLRTIAYMIYKRDQAKERWHKAQKEVFENMCRAFLGMNLPEPPEGSLEPPEMQWWDELFYEDLKLCKLLFSHDRVYGEESYDKKKTNNILKHILRQLKKLAEIDRIYMNVAKSPFQNPYARTYRHSGLQRTNSEQKLFESGSRKRSRNDETNDDEELSAKKRIKKNDRQNSKKMKRNLSLDFDIADNDTADEQQNQARTYNFRHSPNQDEQHSNDSDSHQKENSGKIHKIKNESVNPSNNAGPKRQTKLVKTGDDLEHHHHIHHHRRSHHGQQEKRQRRKSAQTNDNETISIAEAPATLVLKSNNSFERLRGGLRSLRDRVSMAFKRS